MEISPERDIIFNIDVILHLFFGNQGLYMLAASKIPPETKLTEIADL